MKPGGSMPHLQGLSNNPYPELNQLNIIIIIIIIIISTITLKAVVPYSKRNPNTYI